MFPQRLCLLKRSLLALFFTQVLTLKQESVDLALWYRPTVSHFHFQIVVEDKDFTIFVS